MIEKLQFPVTLLTALCSGLIGGIFFAFSNFIMKALAKLPASNGIAAMQGINVTVLNPLFLGLFMGTALCSLYLVVSALLRWNQPVSIWLLAGGLLYFIGTFVVTIVFNVPRNEGLAKMDPASAEAAIVWARYVVEWTLWNHVRTIAALAGAVSLMVALSKLKQATP